MAAEVERALLAKDRCEEQLSEREEEVRAAQERVSQLRGLLAEMEEEMGALRLHNQELVSLQGEPASSPLCQSLPGRQGVSCCLDMCTGSRQ